MIQAGAVPVRHRAAGRRGLVAWATGFSILLSLLACGVGGPDPLPEFETWNEDETPLATHVECADDVLTAELPNGTRATFSRVLTKAEGFHESRKTLTVVPVDGEELSLVFGEWHSGYSTAEIRTDPTFDRISVLSVGERQRHMRSGAAIEISTRRRFPEGHGWAADWARPDTGLLVTRGTFGTEACPGLGPRPEPQSR